MKISGNNISMAFKRDLDKAKVEARNEKKNEGGQFEVYPLKKNGLPYAKPHEYFGKYKWSKEEAEREAARMAELNPGKVFIIKEKEVKMKCEVKFEGFDWLSNFTVRTEKETIILHCTGRWDRMSKPLRAIVEKFERANVSDLPWGKFHPFTIYNEVMTEIKKLSTK